MHDASCNLRCARPSEKVNTGKGWRSVLDPLDKELERRGLRFARYADDFLVLVKSLRAAQRVMQSISRFVEGRLKLVVNRQKSRAA